MTIRLAQSDAGPIRPPKNAWCRLLFPPISKALWVKKNQSAASLSSGSDGEC
ncbi:MAG: hypothetical protein JWP99_1515 [Devosia sp.]|nr:hypothetical protein [Devosia sp.]